MAQRQRSFFDQPTKVSRINHSSYSADLTQSRRPQWHGGNNYYNVARAPPQEQYRPPVTMPSIPASSTSRSKLQAFQFHGLPVDSESKESRHPKSQSDREGEKENQSPLEDQQAMGSSQLLPCPPPMSQRSQHKECPQTPVGRLPLAELIAGVDDNTNKNMNLTPIERVIWQHVPGNTQFTSSQETSASRTGKKRARSSSLTSSQNETSIHFRNNKQSFDLQTLEKPLKTPQADPAADLWTRYSHKIGNIHDGSPTQNATLLAELLKSSSPQTPGSHLKQKETGHLRRSISCANEWPTSAAKRRRLNHTSSQNQMLDDCPAIERRSNARMSRVNLLMEQVQNGLLKGRDQVSKPKPSINSSQSSDKLASDRSSSQLPVLDNHDGDGQEDAEEESDPTSVGGEPAMSELDESDTTFIGADTGLVEDTERVSEFGDDDFDDDLLEAVDASMAPRQSTDANVGQTTQTIRTCQSIETTMQNTIKHTAKSMIDVGQDLGQDRVKKESDSAAASMNTNHTFDAPATRSTAILEDFDEDDNDMSAADIEDLLAVFDKQSPNRRKQSYQSRPQQIPASKAVQELKGSPVTTTKLQTHTKPGSAAVIDVSSDEEYGEEFDFEDIEPDCMEQTQIDSQNMSVRPC